MKVNKCDICGRIYNNNVLHIRIQHYQKLKLFEWETNSNGILKPDVCDECIAKINTTIFEIQDSKELDNDN